MGYEQTAESHPSEYLWIVDADDYLSGKLVLQQIKMFTERNPNLDIINLGWRYKKQYMVAKVGWPIGAWGRVIRSNVYVPALDKNIRVGNDAYSHFVMFDNVDDDKIGEFDQDCYTYPGSSRSGMVNQRGNTMVFARLIGRALMEHPFRKKSVFDALLNSQSGTGQWLKREFPEFKPTLSNDADGRKVTILMASFPYRKKWMLKCMDKLIDQCDNFYLWLNEYKEVPEELKKYDQNKLHIVIGDKNMKENGRYTFLERPEIQNDYCFICDDDIDYPKTYVKTALDCFKRKGNRIVVSYFIDSALKFEGSYNSDTVENINVEFAGISHYRFGLGTAAFIPSLMNFKFTREELEQHYDIEMFIGEECNARGIKVVSPRRPRGFVKFLRSVENSKEVDKFSLHEHGNRQRAERTYNYMLKCGRANR